MLFVILVFTFWSAFVLSHLAFSPVVPRVIDFNERRSRDIADVFDSMFMRVKVNRIALIFTFGPPLLGLAGYLLFPVEIRLLGVLLGILIGFLGPSIYVKVLAKQRKAKFDMQLIDLLMLLSSSLKGGLSLIQALEVVVEEMPDPISQEFNVLLGENKMGVTLEDTFAHLYERMPSIALHQMITAILLARETGGNLPAIFSRIVTTIRENNKIRENLTNLTLQGKIQGVVMTLLPIAFMMIVTTTNKHFFDTMFKSDIGKTLLIYAVISETIGAFLIWKISTFKDF